MSFEQRYTTVAFIKQDYLSALRNLFYILKSIVTNFLFMFETKPDINVKEYNIIPIKDYICPRVDSLSKIMDEK